MCLILALKAQREVELHVPRDCNYDKDRGERSSERESSCECVRPRGAAPQELA